MEQTVTVTIPREWIMGLPEEKLTYKQIFRLGIYIIRLDVQFSCIVTVSDHPATFRSRSDCPNRI